MKIDNDAKKFLEDIHYFMDAYDLNKAETQHFFGWNPSFITMLENQMSKKSFPCNVLFLQYAFNPYIFREMVRMKGREILSRKKEIAVLKKLDELIGEE